MIRIDTDVSEVIVEIEEKEYALAPRTVEVMEKLQEAERSNMGKPVYKLWLAELEILLGKEACQCERTPEESLERIIGHLKRILPRASEREIMKLIK